MTSPVLAWVASMGATAAAVLLLDLAGAVLEFAPPFVAGPVLGMVGGREFLRVGAEWGSDA